MARLVTSSARPRRPAPSPRIILKPARASSGNSSTAAGPHSISKRSLAKAPVEPTQLAGGPPAAVEKLGSVLLWVARATPSARLPATSSAPTVRATSSLTLSRSFSLQSGPRSRLRARSAAVAIVFPRFR